MRFTVINDGVMRPLENMANDVGLWQRVEASPDEAFLRFYDWTETCVTIGFSQHEDNLRAQFPSLSKLYPCPWVKRPTGGGLVEHQQGGITYCLVLPLRWLPSPQLLASYRWLSEHVVAALNEVGVSATLRREALDEFQDKRHHEVCVSFPAKYEIVDSMGYKLVGSAQRKGRRALLQQTQLFGAVPTGYKAALVCSLDQSL